MILHITHLFLSRLDTWLLLMMIGRPFKGAEPHSELKQELT